MFIFLRILTEILGRDHYSVNDEDSESQTALHLAAAAGHVRSLSLLLAGGADLEARNIYLWTALSCAAAHGWTKCVSLLIECGACLHTEDRNRNTPLHLAAKYGHHAVVQIIIEAGGSLASLNLSGQNCLSEAISRGNREVISVILHTENWREAFRFQRLTAVGVMETPIKQLIKRFPDLARIAFDKCISTNLHSRKFKTQNTKTVAADSSMLEVKEIYINLISFTSSFLSDKHGL